MDAEARRQDQHASFDWRRAIREHRRKRRISQPDLAARSGLSLSAVKAYESGRRHPTREALSAIVDALGITADQANPLFAGAGYAANWHAIFHEAYGPRDVPWFTEQVERSTWPVFVTNEASDLIAANRPLRLLHGMALDEVLPQPDRWNYLALASQPWYAERLENWDEAMTFVLGLAKAVMRRDLNPERPAPWNSESYKRFLQGEPAYVTRLLRLWEPAEPVPYTTRVHYRVRWRHESGQLLRFAALMHVADVWQAYAWHDWVPEDAETLRLVQEL